MKVALVCKCLMLGLLHINEFLMKQMFDEIETVFSWHLRLHGVFDIGLFEK